MSQVLTPTGIWTLLIGAMIGGERFTVKKLLGVLASLAGVMLISTVDLSGSNDENRGSFPHKSQGQIAIGDAFALGSAVLYGVYTILMKIRMGDEASVNMPLFFGFVGVFNLLMLWPGFFVLHFTGVETFELPPTKRILAIVLVSYPIHGSMPTLPYLSFFECLLSGTDQFGHILDFRFLLGVRDASYLATHCHGWTRPNYPTVTHRSNDTQLPEFESCVLARCWCCVLLVHLYHL